MRGIGIGLIMAAYSWFAHQPAASLTRMFLIGAALQLIVIALRQWVPLSMRPLTIYLFEFLVDGATVLFFALGVFGGIAHSQDI